MSKAPVAQIVSIRMSKIVITKPPQKLLVPAAKATPSPPVGPALGARGVKAMDFCKEFNARTAHIAVSTPTPTLITIAPDRTFTFTFRTPPTSYLLKQAAQIPKGNGTPGSAIPSGRVTLKHIYEIARIKCRDEALRVIGEEKVARQVLGTARTLGLEVVP